MKILIELFLRFLYIRTARAINSAVECYLHTVEVTGSNPVSPTTLPSATVPDATVALHAHPAFMPVAIHRGKLSRQPTDHQSIRISLYLITTFIALMMRQIKLIPYSGGAPGQAALIPRFSRSLK
jgi:hypothetical protein